MAKSLVSDELWEMVEPLLPPAKPRRLRNPGRKPLDDRKALTGILFVLKSGFPWEMLPQEMGCGSGMTCWRRLREWQEAGVWQELHETLLSQLQEAGRGRRKRTCLNPTDSSKPGSKHHLLTVTNGIPLSATLTGTHRHDVTQLLPLVDGVPPVRGRCGRPRRLPQRLYGDRAYMIPSAMARRCESATSHRRWPGAGRNTGGDWASTGACWSGPWAGCVSSAGCGYDTSAVLTSMKPSSPWAVQSSASDA